MRLRCLLSACCLVAVSAGGAAAEELRLGVRTEGSYTDNLFSARVDEVDDYSLRVSPWLEVADPLGSVQWELAYRPAWEGYAKTDGIDGWDHEVRGEASWQVTPTTVLRVEDRFSEFESVSRFNETLEDDLGELVTETIATRRSFRSNAFSASVEHRLSRAQTLSLALQNQTYDFSEAGTDRTSTGLVGSYFQQLTERLSAGGSLSWRRQIFEGSGGADDRETDFYNLSGRLRYLIDPTFSIDLSAGPALIDGDAPQGFPMELEEFAVDLPRRLDEDGILRFVSVDGCPETEDGTPYLAASCDLVEDFPGGVGRESEALDLPFRGEQPSDSGLRTTFFADIALQKSWEQWSLRLSYRRSDDSSGLGTSAISDRVNLNVAYTPSPRWRFTLGGAWIRRTQTVENRIPVAAVRPRDLTVDVELPALGIMGTIMAEGIADPFAVKTVPVDRDIEQENIVVNLRGSYRLTKRVRLFARAFYVDTSRDQGLGDDTGFDRFSMAVGVSYEFETIRF